MSRRDTIMIAILINAGLLIILFATALPSKHIEVSLPKESPPITKIETVVPAPLVHAALPTDEVDQVLKQYVAESPQFAATMPAIEPIVEKEVSPMMLQEQTAYVEVVVKKGDVLEKIARVHHCHVEEITRLNHLSSTKLHIGQVLRVPKGEKTAPKTVESTDTAIKYYVVKNGDNPWTIAVKNHMKVEELLRLNHLDEEKARRLKPGDQIRIK